MAFTIARETPLQDDVRRLVAQLNTYLKPLSPPEFQFQLTVEQLANADTVLFVGRDDTGAAVGMGALKAHSADLGEVKRMFTAPDVRGAGLGRQILNAIEAEAMAWGIPRLVLETGSTEGFEPAWRVYERGGYTPCGAVLDYPDSGYNAFYEKKLSA
ncbi:MAG: GNAT family N-acetyltransferase [Pseudomonadota bacterium]